MASSVDKTNQFVKEAISEPNTELSEIPHKQKYIQPYRIEGLEDLEDYRKNGLHPVDILDILDGRFEVCHKLGSGGIATVWLCYEAAYKRWRAIKISAASHSSVNSAELRIGKLFEEQAVTSKQLEMHHIILAEETFWLEGPNGKHLCSVLPVLGPSLLQWRDMIVGLNAERIKRVCYEITEGLHYLHEHGICHGDFRPQNILMRLVDGGLDHLDPDDLFGLISLPRRHEVHTLNGEDSLNAPKWVVEPLRWFELKHLVSDRVGVVDFGEAFDVTSPPSFLGIPGSYASPEVAYGGGPFGKESDIWSLALTMMEARTGVQLGDALNSPLNRMESFAGPIPPPYRSVAAEELYQSQLRDFDAYGQRETAKPQPLSEEMLKGTRSLTELFWMNSQAEGESHQETKSPSPEGIEAELGRELWESVFVPEEENIGGENGATKMRPYRIPKRELTILTDLLRRMLKYKPSDRLSTASVLKHRWFKSSLENEQYGTEELDEQLSDFWGEAGSSPVGEVANTSKPDHDTQNLKDVRYGWCHGIFSIMSGERTLLLSICLPILLSLFILWNIW
ncbi:kinase-like domain-containing protein [Xylaria sp. FL1777]|nr:kinase-like domain-containing protein [Xylaria sp. FL1777]